MRKRCHGLPGGNRALSRSRPPRARSARGAAPHCCRNASIGSNCDALRAG
ncbi:hypothetical protein [Lysobacter gummosus]